MFPPDDDARATPETPLNESDPSALTAPLEEQQLADWKDSMRSQFDDWLEELDSIPEPDEEPAQTPDLYSFYTQWMSANAESRKGNRRTAEAFSKWTDVLGHFESDLKSLREQWQRVSAAAPTEGISREHCLMLVELLDRLQRVARAFASPPAVPWWGGLGSWRQAWDGQRQAFDILLGHFESLLKKEGLVRIEVMGQPFDPAAMAAVAAQSDASRPDQTVLEEIAPGYRLRGQLLRPAQVKVSLNKPSNPTHE
jgi:molecular chaperone GrpE (heat shock protein)